MNSWVGGAGGGDVEGERAVVGWLGSFLGECGLEGEEGSRSRCRFDGWAGCGRRVEVLVAGLLLSQGSVRAMSVVCRRRGWVRDRSMGSCVLGLGLRGPRELISLSTALKGPKL